MKGILLVSAASFGAIAGVSANAQEAPMVVARPVVAAVPTNTLTLAANTPVTVRMNEEISTKRNEEGDTFYLSVVSNVVQDGYVIIPAGARAIGTITWMTGRGAFGKSGKMEISISAIEIGSVRVPVIGEFRQEGEGNTVATVGAVVLAGVFGAFVTGHSGVIPAGRELQIHTRDPFTVGLPDAPVAQAVVATPVAAATVASPAAAPSPEPASPTGTPQPVAPPSESASHG